MKLTDFGLSRHFEMRPAAAEDIVGEDNVLTRSFCGTEQYMSPEMLLQQVVLHVYMYIHEFVAFVMNKCARVFACLSYACIL